MIQMIHDPKIMYKFGQTTCDDVAQRFTPEYAIANNFRTNCVLLCRDFKIDIIWSAFVTKEQADQAEIEFASKYPKNITTQVKYNGITECRSFRYDESILITKELRKKYPYQQKKPGMLKIYYVMARKKKVVALELPFQKT